MSWMITNDFFGILEFPANEILKKIGLAVMLFPSKKSTAGMAVCDKSMVVSVSDLNCVGAHHIVLLVKRVTVFGDKHVQILFDLIFYGQIQNPFLFCASGTD